MNKNVTAYKERTFKIGEKVEVYYNLHKSGFTIKSIDPTSEFKGKVVAHASHAHLADCTFFVSSAGIQQIRKKRVKRVCATVRGTLIGTDPIDTESYKPVFFNPYQTEQFLKLETKEPIQTASHVFFYDRFCAAEEELALF